MPKLIEIGLSALAGALLPIIGGIFWLGQQSNRIVESERKVSVLENKSTGPAALAIDPVRKKCVELSALVSGEILNEDPSAAAKAKDAMDALACFRAN